LDDLRATRTLLRKLPRRRAPRNFTLTRTMVGLNPPLPRSYPAFRFVTTIATLLFFFTFGVNALAPQFAQPIGLGGGGGADQTELFSAQAPAATEAPAAAEASVPATEAPIGNADLAPQPTMTAPPQESARMVDTPVAKSPEEEGVASQNPDNIQNETPFIPTAWQILFAVTAIAGGLLLALMRRSSINRWK
jgi:hypothetical protein